MATAPPPAGPSENHDGPAAGPSGSSATAPATQEDDRTPHLLRIASHGKLKTYIAFALKFLQESHTRPLVLHTLPAPSKTTPLPAPAPAAAAVASDPPPQPFKAPAKSLAPCTTSIPRLLSVAEIIKREFVDLSYAQGQGKGKEKETWVLHQYNELGCLEDLEGEGGRTEAGKKGLSLVELLEGKNHLQIKRTPYMKITLTKKLLEGHDAKKSTYQEPLPSKKRSKSARARERKKQKRAETAAVPSEQTSEVLVAPADVAMSDATTAPTEVAQ
ncbi:hypothetical protein CALCODRAFT_289515 [Calocera cornea HHB12733]|uniref:Uncharacterized protein n=1 Tax=Calocera cornea HHB12733 TaxID=1353952 RepID=A0A165FWD4_9BASI|nr:hypothetical protein CALCODRAFT_289515 [Calocera cornea HHB12733]